MSICLAHKKYYLFIYEIPQETPRSKVYKIEYIREKERVCFPRFIQLDSNLKNTEVSNKVANTIAKFVNKYPLQYLAQDPFIQTNKKGE